MCFQKPILGRLLCSVPSSLRTVSWRLSFTNSLNSLKFRVLTVFFARSMFLEVTNSTKALLQPRLFPTLTSSVMFSVLVRARSNKYQSGGSVQHLNQPSVDSRSLLDYLQIVFFPRMYMCGWNLPSGMSLIVTPLAAEAHQKDPLISGGL